MFKRGNLGSYTASCKDLFTSLEELSHRLRNTVRVCLFLDIDGMVPDDISEPLEQLAGDARFSVAVIDNCSLAELKARVKMSSLMYAGNDGLDIEGPGLRFTERGASQSQGAVKTLAERLREQLRNFKDTHVLDHELTLSVSTNGNRREAGEIIRRAVEAEEGAFRVEERAATIDIRPRVPWSKGLAAHWLVAASGAPNALTIYVGDDETDEDAFSSMASGITIKVGGEPHTAAQYHLARQADIGRFLSWLAGN